MQNIRDNQLDNFFKEALENPEIAFNPKAWNSMEKKLDKALIKMLWMNRLRYLSLFILIISFFLVTWNEIGNAKQDFNLIPNKRIEQISENKINYKKDFVSPNNDSFQYKTLQDDNLFINHPTKKLIDSYSKKKRSGNSSKRLLHKNNAYDKAALIIAPTNDETNNGLGKELSNEDRNPIDFKPDQQALASDNQKHKSPNSSGKLTIEEGKDNINNLPSLGAFHFISEPFPIHLSFNSKKLEDITSKVIISKKPIVRPLIRLSGLISPDFSSYSDVTRLKSGYNTGLSLEVFPLKRFSVSGSILKSKKIYSAKPAEYKPYDGFWEGKTLPKNIEGKCKITDLQLNLRYYLVSTNKIQAFAGAGVSSYLLRHEIYTYDYTTWEKTIHISKKNSNYLSVLNLSAGLEHRLTNRLAFGIEPFIKLPVTGIGAGKIKLNSAGAFISLTYLFLNK